MMNLVIGQSYIVRSNDRDLDGCYVGDGCARFPRWPHTYHTTKRELRTGTEVLVMGSRFIDEAVLIEVKTLNGKRGWINTQCIRKMTKRDQRKQHAMKYL